MRGEGGRKFGVGPLSLTASNVCSSRTDVIDNVACTALPHAVAHRAAVWGVEMGRSGMGAETRASN